MEILPGGVGDDDPWDEEIDALRAQAVLAGLGAHHRAALTLRYLDDLTVPQVDRDARPHAARHRGAARAGPRSVPPRLREERRR